jgi:hypothetical protein
MNSGMGGGFGSSPMPMATSPAPTITPPASAPTNSKSAVPQSFPPL